MGQTESEDLIYMAHKVPFELYRGQVGRHPAEHVVHPERFLTCFLSEIHNLFRHALKPGDIALNQAFTLQYGIEKSNAKDYKQ